MVQHGGDTIHCDALPWLPLAPKVFVKIIKLDPETGEHSVMIRAEPGGVLPRHKHLDSAEIFIPRAGYRAAGRSRRKPHGPCDA